MDWKHSTFYPLSTAKLKLSQLCEPCRTCYGIKNDYHGFCERKFNKNQRMGFRTTPALIISRLAH